MRVAARDPFEAPTFQARAIRDPHTGWLVRTGCWLPKGAVLGKVSGKVVVLPGRGDFLEKYALLASFLNNKGYAVYTLDWPGQGGSQRLGQHPQAGHIRSYDDYARVFRAFLEVYGLVGEPLLWLAYSMGAPIALRELLRGSYVVKGVVLISPMFGFAETLPEGVVRVLADLACALGLATRFAWGEGPTDVRTWQIGQSLMVSSPEAFVALRHYLERHPDKLLAGSTWGWVRASLKVFRELRRADLSRIRTPILLVTAEDELTVSPEAQARVARQLPAVTVRELPDKHDLLLSDQATRAQLFSSVSSFFAGLDTFGQTAEAR